MTRRTKDRSDCTSGYIEGIFLELYTLKLPPKRHKKCNFGFNLLLIKDILRGEEDTTSVLFSALI